MHEEVFGSQSQHWSEIFQWFCSNLAFGDGAQTVIRIGVFWMRCMIMPLFVRGLISFDT